MTRLSILCITEHGAHAPPFLTHFEEVSEQLDAALVIHDGRGAGCIENVLDEAVAACPDGMILRLDDDERMSLEMRDWLEDGDWQEHDHWAFPRHNLWPDEHSHITSHGLYPDLQTRLSVKAKSGGRHTVHQGSPYGTGEVAPCAIEHWKFLVRPIEERRELVARYESLQPGAGHRFSQFSVPEDVDWTPTVEPVRVPA